MSGSWGVYPRVCGGAPGAAGSTNEVMGLSPRVRGSRHRFLGPDGLQGSIPACAGEPPAATIRVYPRWRSWPAWVYPRVCGGAAALHRSRRCRRRSIPACAGEPAVSRRRKTGQGVYPRVCGGALRGVLDGVARLGSIPACAGEPWSLQGQDNKSEVYPRVCGGAALMVLQPQRSLGLSPRVRGSPAVASSPVP